MNREKLRQIAKDIRGSVTDMSKVFNMDLYFSDTIKALRKDSLSPLRKVEVEAKEHSCNTVGCIAGLTVSKYRPLILKSGSYDIATEARNILELTTNQSRALFLGKGYSWHSEDFHPDWDNKGELKDITAAHAATVVEHFVDTMDIKWTIPTIEY